MAVVPIFHIKVDPVWQYFSALPTPVRKCCFLLAILTLPQTLNLCSVQHSFPFSPAFLILVYPHQQLWLCNQSLGLLGLQVHSGLLISNTCFALFPGYGSVFIFPDASSLCSLPHLYNILTQFILRRSHVLIFFHSSDAETMGLI